MRDVSAAVSSPEDAAAVPSGSGGTRALLDAAVARTIAVLAHELRNALGVVSMQVEAIAARSASPAPDLTKIQAHAGVASDHIERLADMTNALIAFARGRNSSDLAVMVGEAAALMPMRAVAVTRPALAPLTLDSHLTRTAILEVLVLAIAHPTAPSFAVGTGQAGSTVNVSVGAPLVVDEALEWVVQFQKAGGHITATEDGLRLQFPPIA
jgi:signal transduction histidine kinase